jgi:hypothetical protein
MKITGSTSAKRKERVCFGYLFFNMSHQLCMAISTDKTDTWAIVYQPKGKSGIWDGDVLCPTWWAEIHGAGNQYPNSAQLQHALRKLLDKKLEERSGFMESSIRKRLVKADSSSNPPSEAEMGL